MTEFHASMWQTSQMFPVIRDLQHPFDKAHLVNPMTVAII